MKHCPYCGGPVIGRAPTARYCDPKHARRSAAQRGAETGRRNRAWAAIMARVTERARHRREWRQVAFGQLDVSAIFGAEPAPLDPTDEWNGSAALR